MIPLVIQRPRPVPVMSFGGVEGFEDVAAHGGKEAGAGVGDAKTDAVVAGF